MGWGNKKKINQILNHDPNLKFFQDWTCTVWVFLAVKFTSAANPRRALRTYTRWAV